MFLNPYLIVRVFFIIFVYKIITEMKIKLLKNHLDNITGEVIEVNNERGNYLIRVGVAELKQEKKLKTKE